MYSSNFKETLKAVNFLQFRDLFPEEERDAVWDHVRTSYHGNQQFSNDSIFIYNVCEEMKRWAEFKENPNDNEDEVIDPESFGIEYKIYLKAKEFDCFNTEEDEHIIFNICW